MFPGIAPLPKSERAFCLLGERSPAADHQISPEQGLGLLIDFPFQAFTEGVDGHQGSHTENDGGDEEKKPFTAGTAFPPSHLPDPSIEKVGLFHRARSLLSRNRFSSDPMLPDLRLMIRCVR